MTLKTIAETGHASLIRLPPQTAWETQPNLAGDCDPLAAPTPLHGTQSGHADL